MVELPEVPAVGIVAGLTLGAQPFFMLVMLLMTGETVFFGVFIGGVGMTAFAWGNSMLADERERAQVVIKKDILPPAFLVMTFFAVVFLLPPVHIVVAVTADAVSAGFGFRHRPLVAFAAVKVLVLVPEREFGFIMVIDQFFPALGGVAPLTFFIKFALMVIIMLMARVASSIGLFFVVESAFVALGAVKALMLVLQRKFGFAVIMKRFFPIL